MSFKLARTRHRSVYHADHRYIVPYSDDHDRDRHREFDTLSEARDFKTALRLTEQARRKVDSGSMTKGGEETMGSWGGNIRLIKNPRR